MSRRKIAAFLTSALLGLCAEPACGHGDLHEQIARASAEIDKDAQNADLYLRRGELRRLHAEFPEAAADFDRAATLRPEYPQVSIAKARLALSSGKLEAAVAEMNQLLPKHPEYPEAWLIRARARARLSDYAGAAADYTEIIRRIERPEPEIFLERAAALAALGNDHFAEALDGLGEGLAKIGPVITLDLAALDLELKMERYVQALCRIDQLLNASKRKDSWLARRGDVEVLAGRENAARSSYQEALDAIAGLPPHHQTTPATMELKKRVTESMTKLGRGAKPSS